MMNIKLRSFIDSMPQLAHDIKVKAWGLLMISVLLPGLAMSQEMEPRAYSNAPVGMNFIGATYNLSYGNIIVDASLPVEDFQVTSHTAGTIYVRTMNFFGKHGKVQALLPYTWLSGGMKIAGKDTTGTRAGFSDARVRVSINFIGAPALTRSQFRQYRQKTIVGASLVISFPTGQYFPSKLVNLGTNRWVFKPELGISHRIGNWYLEAFGGILFFTDNTEYFQNTTLSQKPLLNIQGHLSYLFAQGLWLAMNTGYSDGGATSLNGSLRQDFQKNWRLGAVVSFPLGRQHAVKAQVNTGLSTRAGSDFNAFLIAYQYSW